MEDSRRPLCYYFVCFNHHVVLNILKRQDEICETNLMLFIMLIVGTVKILHSSHERLFSRRITLIPASVENQRLACVLPWDAVW